MNIRTMEIDGEIHFNVYDLSIECGCYKISKGKKYPRKDRINNILSKNYIEVLEDEYVKKNGAYTLISNINTEGCKEDVVNFIDNNMIIDTLHISEMMNIRHYDLLRKIDGQNGKIIGFTSILKDNDENINEYFIEDYYLDGANRRLKKYKVTKKGCYMIIQNTRKSKNIEKLVEYIGLYKSNVILSERMEIKFLNQLEDSLKPFKIGGNRQYPIDGGKYRIDYYIPSLGLAIEYDEEQHYTLANKIKDGERQKYIEDKLKCEFVRCSYKNTDAYNIGLVMKKIFKYI